MGYWKSSHGEFNHFTNTCLKRNNPEICGKCDSQYKTESCRSKFLKFVICINARVSTSKAHETVSRNCPILTREQNQIEKRINYWHEKKLIKPCQSRKSLQVSLLNTHSINNKACQFYKFFVESNSDILFVTKTWQLEDVCPAFKAVTPFTHNFYHVIRPGTVSSNAGDGLGVIVKWQIPNVKFSCRKFNTFECMEIQFNCASDKILAYLVYRTAGHTTNDFFVDFES